MTPNAFIQTQHAAATAVTFLVVYFGALAIGRLLKRKAHVPLGVFFQFFCLVLAFYAAIYVYGVEASWRNHVGALLILLSTTLVVGLIDRFVWEAYFERRRQTPIPKLLREIAALVIFVIALLMVLSVGYHAQGELKGLLAGSGVFAIILAFATQNLLGSIIAGLSLQIGRPFRVGDWLQAGDRMGEVMEINWRATRLRTNDNIYLEVPNNEIIKQTIVNLHYPSGLHAMRLRVGVDYNVPPNRVKDALFRAVISAEHVVSEPKPHVFVIDFGDSAVHYEVKYYLNNHALFNEATDSVRTNIWYELKREKMTIPFPIRTLQLPPRSSPNKAPEGFDEARTLLRRQQLFQCLSENQLEELLKNASLVYFGRGERLINEGAEDDSMFVLVRGTAHVSVSKNGSVIRVGVLRSGDCFGEMSLLTGEKRTASVRADDDCYVLEISKLVMAEVIRQAPACLDQLSELLAKRRLETEGIVKDAANEQPERAREREYRDTFLRRLRSIFEL